MPFDVVMLTSAHPATDDRIFYREAKTLAEAGYAVCVVGRHPRSELVDGIYIHALSAVGGRFARLLQQREVLKVARELAGTIYIFHDPELIAVGLMLRALGKVVVYDAHENLPKQILQKDWIPRPLRWLIAPIAGAIEYMSSWPLSGVFAAVPAIESRFPKSRTILVRNFPTRVALNVLSEGKPITSRPDVVIYTGCFSPVRGTRELVMAFREDLHDVQLWLVGKFQDATFEQEILSSLPPNVKWLGWKEHPETLYLYREAKIGALLLHDTPNHRCALPVKLFEYLGAGLPVISSNFPEYAPYVQGCGVLVDPEDIFSIRDGIRELLSDSRRLEAMSTTARERAMRLYSWEAEGMRLTEFCARHLARRSGEPKISASIASPLH